MDRTPNSSCTAKLLMLSTSQDHTLQFCGFQEAAPVVCTADLTPLQLMDSECGPTETHSVNSTRWHFGALWDIYF